MDAAQRAIVQRDVGETRDEHQTEPTTHRQRLGEPRSIGKRPIRTGDVTGRREVWKAGAGAGVVNCDAIGSCGPAVRIGEPGAALVIRTTPPNARLSDPDPAKKIRIG
jgi:hypothetical protein